jgi:predicted xylose isomerase-like sugar epimerase
MRPAEPTVPVVVEAARGASLRLIHLAADAQRTGSPAVVVVPFTDTTSVRRSSSVLRFAHALGLRTILDAHGTAVEHLAARRPELVRPTLRAADAVVVRSPRTASLVRELSRGRLRVEIAAERSTITLQRLERTLAA